MKKIVHVKAGELFETLKQDLKEHYDEREAGSIVHFLLEGRLNIKKTDILVNKSIPLEQELLKVVHDNVTRIKDFEPVQYVVGFTEFHGLIIKVNRSVLIPRPETEELVDLVVEENKGRALKILDIGTGSGCIALAIKSKMRSSEIHAIDVSAEAVVLANESAMINRLHVNFMVSDIFKDRPPQRDYDIWVSNPPYVRNIEKRLMHENVLKYEPEHALFVPDSDPLLYYRTILQLGRTHLKPEGKVYLEINEAFGKEMLELMDREGYFDGRIVRDLHGKDRMVTGRRRERSVARP